jgi:hypothetical protein
MGKKQPDFDGVQARKMTPRQILRELKKGKTVSGYNDYIAEHYGKDVVKDVPLREIEKIAKKMGSTWETQTIKTRPGGGTLASVRELFGKGKGQPPPPGRTSWW